MKNMLRPNTIKPSKGAKTSVKRKGRGNASGKGNYSGRGMKGQRARSGGKGGLKMLGFKSLMQSTPKLRGFNSLKKSDVEIRTGELEKHFSAGETVSLSSLKEKKLIAKTTKSVKIILKGELKKKLTVAGLKMTKGAKELIEKAGGEIK